MSAGESAGAAAELSRRLGLDDDELLRILDVDPLSLVAGELDHRPEPAILIDLLDALGDAVSPELLRRWLRTGPPGGAPLDLLLAHDFAAFERALDELAQRGFILGRRPASAAKRRTDDGTSAPQDDRTRRA